MTPFRSVATKICKKIMIIVKTILKKYGTRFESRISCLYNIYL